MLLWFVSLNTFSQESTAKVNQQGKDISSLKHTWRAKWITHPTANVLDYNVFLYRRSFLLDTLPESFIIYLSADNKYSLFINGKRILDGPAKSDLNHWNYDTIDLAKYLKKGENIIGVQVTNFGIYRHAAQVTFQTAFILQGHETNPVNIDTNIENQWIVTCDKAYSYTPFVSDSVGGYYAAGPGDVFNAKLHPWQWNEEGYQTDSTWLNPKAAMVEFAVGRGFLYGSTWFLVPRSIPFLEEKTERNFKVIRTVGNLEETKERNHVRWTIPKNTKTTILFDNNVHTIGFPELWYSAGKGSKIKITYSEALFYRTSTSYSAHGGFKKGHRNENWDEKEIRGYYDIIYPDGGEGRVFRPQAMRTFRFIQLDITTEDEDVIIEDFYNVFTAYPFKKTNNFECDNVEFIQILEMAWRTLRNSSTDNFIDPYYEQLQYIGDSRIESLVSIYSTNDDRLMKNAINQFDQSRLNIGLTCSRYPSYIVQIIPTYSLLWIGMVHDFYMYRDDINFVRQQIPGILSILSYFESKIDDTGMLANLEWWNFTDWAKGFDNGIPPGTDDGHSANVTLQFVLAIQNAIPILEKFGYTKEVEKYKNIEQRLQAAVLKHCYNPIRKLIAERPEKDIYSQHTNVFAILTNTIENDKDAIQKIMTDTTLIQGTIYFRFYLNRALQKTNNGNEYFNLLNPWKNMLNQGMTTFGETDIDPRSDCHAWSTSPLFEAYHTIAGIQPLEPSFRKVLIEPNLNTLKFIKTSFTLPNGKIIKIDLYKDLQSGLPKGTIDIPSDVSVLYRQSGWEKVLESGVNLIN